MDNRESKYGKPWSETEYILVLDAYFKNRTKPVHQNAPHVRRLATLIGRTPDSIAMRLENFASRDPLESHRSGLRKIGPSGERVIAEWFNDSNALSKCAAVLRRQLEGDREPGLFDVETTPKVFGKYIVEDLWREGGFARVYSCRRESDSAMFALKVFRSERLTTGSPDGLDRFRREIRILRDLRHPRVIRVYEDSLDSRSHDPAYVMDLAEHSLTEYLAQQAFTGTDSPVRRPAVSNDEARDVFLAACEGVAALHGGDTPMLHRDVNPNNILFVQGPGWVLADFGLAKYVSQIASVSTFATRTGPGIGTLHYAAPEQIKDMKSAGVPADVYSLGVLLWELHSAHVAFLRDHLDVPEWIEPVIQRAIARDPEDRQGSVIELVQEYKNAAAVSA